MRKYVVKLPRGIEVDIFNLPEDFEEQIKESFEGYTEETKMQVCILTSAMMTTIFSIRFRKCW